MTFNYKPKIILKNTNSKEFFEIYKGYILNPEYKIFFENILEEDRTCQYCRDHISLGHQIYGIPICMKTEESKIQFDVCGVYCSLQCSYVHYRNMEEDSARKKNVKFTDSGPFFKFLFYKFFKDYDIHKFDKKIDLSSKNIWFNFVPSNIIC